MEDEQETSYLRHRRKKSSMSLSCCFPGHSHSRRFDSSDSSSSSSPMMSPASSWFRSKGHHELPEVKGKSPRNFMSRMGGRHARRHSGDFSYDPLSYSLNFDTSSDTHFDDFAARLPVSPPRRRPSLSTQISNLELSSSQKSAAALPKIKVAATQIRNLELSSPQKSATAPKAKVPEIPSPSRTAVAGGKGTVEQTQTAGREISVEY